MGTIRDAEFKVILDLTELLNKNADKVKSGETNVCLTTSSLSILSVSFRRYSESKERQEEEGAGPSNWIARLKKKKSSSVDQGKWRENVRALFDFVIKIKSLKIINGSNTLKAPVQIARFKALQVLEIKKVPIHMVEGLSKLRGQLTDIIVTRCSPTLQDVLEICGGDRSSGFVWTNLKSVYVSFNGFKHLDNSLRFIPFVEILDLSHNNIRNTEDFLQHLTDISKINFGYNMLSSIPQFSYSNKGKLKTLVLRNNNLDNLEGIDELRLLEELDVSENCLIEHSVLRVLSTLDRLRVLWLIGNPLYYTSNHRVVTVKYISPGVRLGEFLLDGQSLSADEVFVARKNKYNRGTDQPDSTITITEDPPSTDEPLKVQRLSKRDMSGLQLSPNQSHSDKKKRGHRRVKSRERIPKIADISDSQNDSYGLTDESPIGSSKEEEFITAQIEMDKKKIEIMRKHYKDDWLKALSADRGKSTEGAESGASKGDTGIDKSLDENSRTDLTDGRSFNNEKQEKITNNGSDENDGKITMKDDPIVTDTSQTMPSPIEKAMPTLIQIEKSTDIYAFSRMNSREYLLEPQKAVVMEESYEQYGEESDPFIVMLPEDEMSHLIVTVNNRYIIEKNLNGEKREALDLKFLQDFQRSEEQLSGQDIVWGVTFTVVSLKFDYARKDMRERRYAMEDEAFADKLESLLSGHLKKEDEDLVECLKCQYRFTRTTTSQSSLPACPKCKSKMLIKVDPSTEDLQEATTAITTTMEPKSVSPKTSPKFQRRPAYRHSTQKQTSSKFTSSDVNESHQVTDYPPAEELKSNTSWSDVQKAAVSARGSVSSVESDITILASHSNKSGASISELSQECLLESESEQFYSMAVKQSESQLGSSPEKQKMSTSIDIQSRSLTEKSESFGWAKEKKEQLTPVGSPLTNSVCSSMVSSVYENTIPISDKHVDIGSGENTQDSSFTSSSTDSLSVRHRTSTHNRPKSTNRNAVMCTDSGQDFDVQVSDMLDRSDSSSGTVPSINVSDLERDKSAHSIYDTVSEEDSLDRSHDLSLTTSDISQTEDKSIHSSPMKRKGSARKSRDNRSAIYSDPNSESYDSSRSVGLSDFPFDVSPIKRSGSSRVGRKDNRSAVVMGNEYWPSEESIFKDTSHASVDVLDTGDDDKYSNNESKDSSLNAKPLPWEEGIADLPLAGVNLDEFRNVDHRVQLYLELKVFQAEELCQCAIQCDIVQYMKLEPVQSLMVISTHRLLIFKVDKDQESYASSDWLNCYEDQPIAELRYIDIGLGYQSLRIEFNTTCSSFTLLIADESRCKNFLALITDIVHSIDHSRLEGISKSNPVTLANVDSDILLIDDTEEEILEEDRQVLVRYLIVRYTDEDSDSDSGIMLGLAVTTTDLVLIEENYQWPLPRLQAPLSDSLKTKQFTTLRREKINNIESLMFNEYNPKELRLSFFETSDANLKSVWMISMETTGGVKSFVDAIRNPWEEEFGVTLDVTSTSFTDESNTSKQ